jgi:hypothetical protein
MEPIMNNSEILKVFTFQRGYLSLLVDDIANEKMCLQPGSVVNHPAWHLGHLAWVADRGVGMLLGASSLDSEWEKKFAPNTTPTPQRSEYPPKNELLAIFDGRRDMLAKAFAQASPDDLAKPNPIARIVQQMPTIGVFLAFVMLSHESNHLGQLASWRKAMGMPQALSKLAR